MNEVTTWATKAKTSDIAKWKSSMNVGPMFHHYVQDEALVHQLVDAVHASTVLLPR